MEHKNQQFLKGERHTAGSFDGFHWNSPAAFHGKAARV